MISIKNGHEIKLLKEGGTILSGILKELVAIIRPGITTGELENLACELIKKAGGRPSFKGYKTRHDIRPYPTALCTSINNEVVHAPSLPPRNLKEGDIISLDIGMEYPFGSSRRGLYTDMAVTVGVGRIDPAAEKLIETTKAALEAGIRMVKAGNTLNDIGREIEKYVVKHGLTVVRDLVGHGIGYEPHEDPQIPNYEFNEKYLDDFVLKSGMILAIEPMVNIGSHEVIGGDDNFTITTEDGSLSAHFEHTVAVTADGCLIITE